MPPSSKPVKPISPADFKELLPSAKSKAIDTLVEYINGVLDTYAGEMQTLGFVDILDRADSAIWRKWSGEVVQRFVDAGWRAEKNDAATIPTYRFFLPQ